MDTRARAGTDSEPRAGGEKRRSSRRTSYGTLLAKLARKRQKIENRQLLATRPLAPYHVQPVYTRPGAPKDEPARVEVEPLRTLAADVIWRRRLWEELEGNDGLSAEIFRIMLDDASAECTYCDEWHYMTMKCGSCNEPTCLKCQCHFRYSRCIVCCKHGECSPEREEWVESRVDRQLEEEV